MSPAHIRSCSRGESRVTPLNSESQVEHARLYTFDHILRTNKDLQFF